MMLATAMRNLCIAAMLVACVPPEASVVEDRGSSAEDTSSASTERIQPVEGPAELLRRSSTQRYPGGNTYHCGGDECNAGAPSVRLRTPKSLERVDVTMTFTVEYRTTAGDPALLRSSLRREGREGPSIPLRPRVFRISSTDRTTTTATWVKKGLRAEGHAYKFYVQLNPVMPAFGEPTAELVVYRFTHVVDATPAAAER